jgi:hypothetical protein
MIARTVLRHVQKGLSHPAKRCRLSFKTVNLSPNCPRQDRFRSVSTKFSEFVFEMLLGLRGDIPELLLTLEVGDELSGCAHPPTIGEMAV